MARKRKAPTVDSTPTKTPPKDPLDGILVPFSAAYPTVYEPPLPEHVCVYTAVFDGPQHLPDGTRGGKYETSTLTFEAGWLLLDNTHYYPASRVRHVVRRSR